MCSGWLSSPVELLPSEGETERRSDHHPVADRGQGFPDELFVAERPVDLSGIEEGDAEIDGTSDHRDASCSSTAGP
jgi:hypothetical protein